jgi:hypothetical protein
LPGVFRLDLTVSRGKTTASGRRPLGEAKPARGDTTLVRS